MNYVDDSQIYDYDHPEDDHSRHSGRPQSRASQHSVSQRDQERYRAQQEYQSQNQNPNRGYYQDTQHHQDDDDDDDDMW